jgi:predicted DNA-binding transcriptional regulator AlpA
MEQKNNQLFEGKAFLRLTDILNALSIGKTSLYRGIREGIYPKPVRHNGCSLWAVEDIRQLISDIANGKIDSNTQQASGGEK